MPAELATIDTTAQNDAAVSQRADELLDAHRSKIYRRTDRLFAVLMVLQWLAAMGAALWIAPRTWVGAASQTHVHIWAALLLGGTLTSLPVVLAWFRPGIRTTRYVIAVAQVLMSALLIHLTGGRIETHFHVFGSLALLAAYRDWRVLAISTAVIGLDHALRGALWPESVYGVLSASSWRSLEHTGWVLFEDAFLLVILHQSLTEMRHIAFHRATLEANHRLTEARVIDRTVELENAQQLLQQHTDYLEHANLELSRAKSKLDTTVEELSTKNSELDEFTYVASHDLQEPVRKLISFSRLLKQDIGDNLSEDAEKDLKFIVDAATRMRDLIQDLLALSRAGRSALRREPVALDACVDLALESLEISVQESEAEFARDSLPTVVGDVTTLTQLYQNLIGNALKFVADDKPRIALTAERQGESWILGVKDNGIGMKPEYCERIFQPFQRLHGRGTYAGTGIGLAICKKTVQRHEGTIWVESEPGAGAHFKFTIPAFDLENPPCHTNESETPSELSYC